MRFPPSYYQIEDEIATYFPGLRPAQVSCLALWVIGRLLSGSCLQTKVVSALSAWAHADALRQRLREGLYDGRDRAAPCATQIEVEVCWPWLFAWVCALWDGGRLPLALDPTYERDRLVSVSLSVLYRGGAVSVAAVVLPANRKGDGLPDLLRVLEAFEGVPRPRREILVMTDRGLWSPALWSAFRRLGWHPIMRVHQGAAFRPEGGRRFRPAREWAGGAGRLFVRGGTPVRAGRDACSCGAGRLFVRRGTLFRKAKKRVEGTLIVYWEAGEEEPWVLFTDLAPDRGIVKWYGLRYWIEAGFRSLKSYGWEWERTRRTDPKRAARHWLAMQMATVWALAYGTRLEDAEAAKLSPDRLKKPRPVAEPIRRSQSVVSRGIARLRVALIRGRLWTRLWLTPEPLPRPCRWVVEVSHPIT